MEIGPRDAGGLSCDWMEDEPVGQSDVYFTSFRSSANLAAVPGSVAEVMILATENELAQVASQTRLIRPRFPPPPPVSTSVGSSCMES